jgi:molybdate transport system regulatory protein
LTLRLDFANGGQIGPGKIRLLEEIDRLGSISAGGRALGMSYRRAWILVDEVNRIFTQPAVTTQSGGSGGGGAALTDWGRALVALYRGVEAGARTGAAAPMAALEQALAPAMPPSKPEPRSSGR